MLKILSIFASLSFNSMTVNINNIALATPPIHWIGTQQPLSENKGNHICGIYKITSPSGKIYIGQSIDCERRKKQYVRSHAKKQWLLYNSIQKHGWTAHKFEIIHKCQPEQLNELEVYYIELFQCFNSEHGLNLKSGGDNKIKFSDKSLKKLHLAKLGNKICVGRLPWNKGKKGIYPIDYLDKLRKAKLGNKFGLGKTGWNKGLTALTDERVNKIAKSHIGKSYGALKQKNKSICGASPK